ncbi:MAG: O-succinylhomoserine sulfhydrylase [Alphaproteobacteria bacterium]|nr:O-succinylhomoserine sulfhydrylase [Alphaproteobacteria bacterium]
MATNKTPGKWRKRTIGVRGATMRSPFQETSEALFLTSGYAYENSEEAEARFKGEIPGYQYSRYANPTVTMFEQRMAMLEGAPLAQATSTGMAAVSAALLSALNAGDHIVAAKAMFGSCLNVVTDILPRFGVSHTLVDGGDVAQWKAALKPNTRMFFLETPSNPTLSIVDLKAVGQVANDAGVWLVVDNAFASPILQRPLEFGAHVSVHSSTKYIDGQGRALGGVVCCTEEFYKKYLQTWIRNTGPSISPFTAWMHLKSLETLDMRMRQHCENAAKVADFLAAQRKVTRVLYPFRADHPQHNLARAQMEAGGGIVAFEIEGGKKAAYKLSNALGIIDISNNLGDAKSIITHPETTTHSKLTPEARAELGVTSGLLRLSVGLEDADDLCEDLEQAIKAA